MALRRRRIWLALAAIVFATAAVVVGLLDRDDGVVAVHYPRDRDDDGGGAAGGARVSRDDDGAAVAGDEEGGERLGVPGTLPTLAQSPAAAAKAALRRALSPPGRGHLLIDYQRVGASPLAQRILRCRGEGALRGVEALRDRYGLDLQRDLAHIGVGSGVVGIGGRLEGLRLPGGAGGGRSYGDAARIYTLPAGEGDVAARYIALLGGAGALMADDVGELEAAVDRAEGRASAEGASAGAADIEGVLLAQDFKGMLEGDAATPGGELAALQRLVGRVGLRVDVRDHAAMSLDLSAADAAGAAEMAKVVRSGLALMRQVARAEDNTALAQLLDRARVHDPEGDGLALDLAVPGAWILARMGCDAEGRPLPAPGGGADASGDPAVGLDAAP